MSQGAARQITLVALPGIPEVRRDDDLGEIITNALAEADLRLQDGDVVVITQKIVSKAEGCLVDLNTVEPSSEALSLATRTDKDPRLVEVILRESRSVIRERRGLLIVETQHGWICANAGVDRSNVAGPDAEMVLTLPADPDASARRIRDGLRALAIEHGGVSPDIAVIITDTHGRAWRLATVNLAIGVAGMQPIVDYRGQRDRSGYTLRATTVARADELAAAAGLLSGQAAESLPVVLIRGADWQSGDGAATDLQRSVEKDLFR